MFFKVLGACSRAIYLLACGTVIATPSTHAQNLQDQSNRNTILHIQIHNESELTGNYTINELDEITLPLIGTVSIKDLTESQIQEKLTKLYKQGYLVLPVIKVKKIYSNDQQQVHIAETETADSNRNIYILGNVKNPGRYELPNDADHLLKALALAGGFEGSIKGKNIEIMRGQEKISYKEQTYIPQAGDVIIVKTRYFWAGNR